MDIADAAATVKPSVSLSEPATYQRVYYDFTAEVVEIRGGNGNDTFISDDSMAAMKVYGDRGNDNFLIGRVLDTTRREIDGILIDLVNGEHNATPGISYNADFFGGRGDDYFEVNHNVGVLRMFGEAGDDLFFLKALLVWHGGDTASEADGGEISAGAGDINGIKEAGDKDTLIDYIENNRIEIYGGSGFDTVVVAGTAIADEFYIFTDNDGTQYFYGAGIKLEKLDSIERIAVLTGAGDDTSSSISVPGTTKLSLVVTAKHSRLPILQAMRFIPLNTRFIEMFTRVIMAHCSITTCYWYVALHRVVGLIRLLKPGSMSSRINGTLPVT